MARFKLVLEYDGAGFVGWQRQDNGPSVQSALEEAVAAFCGESVTVHAAGRTDAGVHATGQVAHLDLVKDSSSETLMHALNFHLKPRPVAVLAAEAAPPDFHARFSAIRRSYLYRIVNRRAPLALERGRALWVPHPLDVEAMRQAAIHLVGRHDFSSFRASECQAASPLKTLDRLEVSGSSASGVEVVAEARSFLHHQVRNMVGTLLLVGKKRWPVTRIAEALAARDRRAAGPTAPAHGLYLTAVGYPNGEPDSADHGFDRDGDDEA